MTLLATWVHLLTGLGVLLSLLKFAKIQEAIAQNYQDLQKIKRHFLIHEDIPGDWDDVLEEEEEKD